MRKKNRKGKSIVFQNNLRYKMLTIIIAQGIVPKSYILTLVKKKKAVLPNSRGDKIPKVCSVPGC